MVTYHACSACRKQVTGAPYGVSYGGGEERESR